MRDLARGLRRQSTLQLLLGALALAWLAAVALVQLTGPALGPADVGSSPDGVAAGHVARLVSSSLVIDDDLPLGQWALLAAVTAVVLARHGAVVWWLAALVGHVGSALAAYAAIGVAVALGSGTADRVSDDWDYGVSCVLAAQLGVLVLSSAQRLRGGRGGPLDGLVLAVAAVSLVVWLVTIDWFGLEHPIAFALGAATLAACERVAPRGARSGAPS